MEMNRFAYCLAVVLLCSCMQNKQPESFVSGVVPLFSLSPSIIPCADSDNVGDVFLENHAGFGFSVEVSAGGEWYSLVGSPQSCDSVRTLAEGGMLDKGWNCRYTFITPGNDWYLTDYDDTNWEYGHGPFGPDGNSSTPWSSRNLYIRRYFEYGGSFQEGVMTLDFCLNGEAQIYINGIPVGTVRGNGLLKKVTLSVENGQFLRTGRNLMAIRCVNSSMAGDSVADFGLSAEISNPLRKAEILNISANSSMTMMSFRCGKTSAELSFISPDEYFGCSPLNYMQCKLSSDAKCEDLRLRVHFNLKYLFDSLSIEDSKRHGKIIVCKNNCASLFHGIFGRPIWGAMHIGALSGDATHTVNNGIVYVEFEKTRQKTLDETIFVGYEEEYVLQLFGENIRPLWNRNGNKEITSLIVKNPRNLCRNALKDSRPPSLRILKSKMRLGIDKNGNFIYVTDGYINRMSELSGMADSLSVFGEKELLEGLINPLVLYAESEYWKAPFCPTDLGAYPYAMHRISDDMDYDKITADAIGIVESIDSIAGNSNYSDKHAKVINSWRSFIGQ